MDIDYINRQIEYEKDRHYKAMAYLNSQKLKENEQHRRTMNNLKFQKEQAKKYKSH